MIQDEEFDQSSGLSSEEEIYYQSTDDDEELYDEITFDYFSAPNANPEPVHFDESNPSTNFGDLWILLWIFKYQDRFRLSDVAIDALINIRKFF